MLENKIVFYLNEKLVKMKVKPSESIWDVLQRKELFGTKKSCGEGDCGSCTIAINDRDKKGVYKAITSCITPATKMHKRHIITIEGLGNPEDTHTIQQIIFDNHATQCGFCTPGIIMSLFSNLSENKVVTLNSLNKSLEGNLCRCTGYKHIIKANEDIIDMVNTKRLNSDNLLPNFCQDILDKIENIPDKIEQIETEIEDATDINSYHLFSDTQELTEKMDSYQDFKIVSGATDIFVEKNVRKKYYKNYFDISRIKELKGIEFKDDNIVIGATETLENVMNNELVKKYIPSINKSLFWMASRQIRNIASLAGNIGNASPIGDASSILVGLDAVVELLSSAGKRQVKLEKYFLDYKKTVLKANEIISKIIVPIQKQDEFYDFIKTTKRKNLDISTVNSFCRLKIDNEGIIKDIKLVYGGVYVYPKLAENTIPELLNKNISNLDFDKIAELLHKDFTPISDVRASNKYRNLLIKNHLIKHLENYKNEVKK